MKFVDLSSSSRIHRQADLTRSLGLCRTPHEALVRYCKYLGEAYPTRAHVVISTHALPADQCRVWRFRGGDGVEHLELNDPWEMLDAPVQSGATLSRVLADATPRLVEDIAWEQGSGFDQRLREYRSLIAVPLFNDRLPLNWSLSLSRDPAYFSLADLEETVSRAPLIGSLLDSLHVRGQLAQAHRQIDAELDRMARIQRGLLPDPIPEIPHLQIAASYETFAQVGGDLYDFVPLACDPPQWCIFIGDASGHGPAAAVGSAVTQAVLHAVAATCIGPAELFGKLNQHLCRKRVDGSFVTAFVGFFDPSTMRLTYSSAGHPPPMLKGANLSTTVLLDKAGGLPLGILPDTSYDQASIPLSPGQTLLLYTDGITEAHGPAAHDMFGVEGIEHSLRECRGDAFCVINNLRQSLTAYQRGRRPVDDQTVIAIRVGES